MDLRKATSKQVQHVWRAANLRFENWAETVQNTPNISFHPKTSEDVVKVVNWARTHGKRVRCSGYMHSFSNIFSQVRASRARCWLLRAASQRHPGLQSD